MVVLDIAIVNVALPSIKVDLGFSQENLQWVISAYALVFGGFLLLGGRAADLLGRRRMFIVGLVVFTGRRRSLAALAWNEPSLIGARALQGLGAAIIAPGGALDPDDDLRRGQASATSRSASGARSAGSAPPPACCSAASSPTSSAGSGSSSSTSRSGSTALALAPVLLGESRDAARQSFDALGAVLVTGGLSTAVFGITQANDWGWSSARTIGVFAAAVALLVGFVVRETRATRPAHVVLDLPDQDGRGRERRRASSSARRCSRCS